MNIKDLHDKIISVMMIYIAQIGWSLRTILKIDNE